MSFGSVLQTWRLVIQDRLNGNNRQKCLTQVFWEFVGETNKYETSLQTKSKNKAKAKLK